MESYIRNSYIVHRVDEVIASVDDAGRVLAQIDGYLIVTLDRVPDLRALLAGLDPPVYLPVQISEPTQPPLPSA